MCVGGTFDQHVGHKLWSLAAYSTSKRLAVGVSDLPLLKKKTLRELIEPVELRMANVEDFLHSIKPGLAYDLFPLQDGFGASITDPDLQAILVSEESVKGGELCNVKRSEKGMQPMAVVPMPLVDEGQAEEGATIEEESKTSSTDKRKALLAKLKGGQKHWCRRNDVDKPYVIGLTGGIASGKSTARRLLMEIANEREGAVAQSIKVAELDCDKLAHEAYLPGTTAYTQLIEAFGSGIVEGGGDGGGGGAINRKALGGIVFSDPSAMQTLNNIAWPATASLAKQEIEKSNASIVIMEAAVLLEAGWEEFVDEVCKPRITAAAQHLPPLTTHRSLPSSLPHRSG